MKREKSFTLAETVMALVIMFIILGGMVYGVGLYSRSIGSGYFHDIASYAAQQKLEEIASNIGNITSYNGHTFNVTDRQSNNLLALASGAPVGSVTVIQNSDVSNLYDVSVTINWENSGRRQSLVLDTSMIQK